MVVTSIILGKVTVYKECMCENISSNRLFFDLRESFCIYREKK